MHVGSNDLSPRVTRSRSRSPRTHRSSSRSPRVTSSGSRSPRAGGSRTDRARSRSPIRHRQTDKQSGDEGKRKDNRDTSSKGSEIQVLIEKVTKMQDDIAALNDKKQKKKPAKIHQRVRYYTRRAHAKGIDRGMSWTFGARKRCTDDDNLELTDYIKNFVRTAKDQVDSFDILGAIERYFRSRSDASKRDEPKHRAKSAAYQRRKQKATRREQACNAKSSYSSSKKERVLAALNQAYMSSDEEENGSFITRPLTWESEELRECKKELDEKYRLIGKKKSVNQMYKCKLGEPSDRAAPAVPTELRWILK